MIPSSVVRRSDPRRVLELRTADGPGGGPEKTILQGATLADPSRFEVVVCYLREHNDKDPTIRSRAEALGVDYHEIRHRHALDGNIWPALRKLVRAQRIDLVHAHDYKSDFLTFLLARHEGVATMATAHGWTGHSRRERWLYYPADQRLLTRFPMVLAVSSAIREELVRQGAKPERVRVLLNGIDHRRFQRDPGRVQEARKALGVPDDALVLGSVGRVEPQKRFDLLLEAFDHLRGDYPQARLLVAGEGSQRTFLQAEAERRGLGGVCRFVGHREPVLDFYHALDLFVQSSQYEGTPNVVLEAMALEVPVVATSAGGTAELIEDSVHGRIVPTNDGAALTSAIRAALDDPVATAQCAHAARQRVETELSFEQRCQRLDAFYGELLSLPSESRSHLVPEPVP